jgi:hypothetical protein
VALVKLAFVVALAFLTVGLAGCAQDKDSDGDGLYDGNERRGWTVVVHGMTQRIQYQAHSNPDLIDSDGDGLTDFEEFYNIPALDPSKKDTDGDGLTDCQEVYHTILADCENPDYAGPFDGGYLGKLGINPTHADSDPGQTRYVNDILGYMDKNGEPISQQHGDGISDGDEIMGYEVTVLGRTEIITSNPMDADHDDDLLEDGAELYFGSSPILPDTDGDTCMDGFDNDPTQATTYRLNPQTFLLKEDFDTLGGADVHLVISFHGQEIRIPEGSSFKAQTGENVDISQYDPGNLVITCEENASPFTPWNPQLKITIQAVDLDGQTYQTIPLNPTAFYWNTRDNSWGEGKTEGVQSTGMNAESSSAKITFNPKIL